MAADQPLELTLVYTIINYAAKNWGQVSNAHINLRLRA